MDEIKCTIEGLSQLLRLFLIINRFLQTAIKEPGYNFYLTENVEAIPG